MDIVIANCQRTRTIDRRFLKEITRLLLAELNIAPAGLDVNLVAAAQMTRLNETYLRHAGSTDVIAFDYSSPRPQTSKPKPQIHGEIFICVDEAVAQARRFGTSWQSEIVRYLVHGVLHLLGFDDATPGARRRMKREENRRLRRLADRFSLAQLSRPARISA
ncbi:MAG TPA: rRNA maturation RNase YbeY [Candidatus Acidoferrum sp.]|nr:rRNA maturation RNase YbeY [Candidatus Acidoferrum sp.]